MSDRTLIKYENVEICQQDHIVLKDVNIEIKSGEFIFLLGKVGSGKSTFLKSLYAEVPLYDGSAEVLDYNLIKIKRKEIPNLRRKIGIVFQDFQLLIDRTVNANLEFVLKATGWKDKKAIADQIHHVLKQVGMQTKGYKMPHQLSGGEQQRIVIARALLNSPEIILADEPTGNLDPNTGEDITDLLYSIRKSGTTVIMSTHNLNWVDMYEAKVLVCEDGLLLDKTDQKHTAD
ncbi:MAG: ATP-binding cassette domain-containing protein [Porphyromonadaceae bacterium]|nr:ATP-binding cassette domain-containing protein [Porphyromonadaceae bacterium]